MILYEAMKTGKKIYRQRWRDHDVSVSLSELAVSPKNGKYTIELTVDDYRADDWKVLEEAPVYDRNQCIILLTDLKSSLFVTETLIDSILYHLKHKEFDV